MKLKLSVVPLCRAPVQKLLPLTIDDKDSNMRHTLFLAERGFTRGRYAVLAKYKNNIIGWATLNSLPEFGFININVFVHPDYRKLGVGSDIVQRAKVFSTKRYSTLYIRAYPFDKKGKQFFRKNSILFDTPIRTAWL